MHKQLFLVSRYMRPIHKFLIAYDGKDDANKAVEFFCHSDLLKGLECHIITVGADHQTQANEAAQKIRTSWLHGCYPQRNKRAY